MPEEGEEHLLERIADEVIAVFLVAVFGCVSSILALAGKVEELKMFAAVVGPPVLTIIGFYFGRRTTEKGAELAA